MDNWFLATAKVERALPNGKVKNVSELYLVDAMSCTEAETKVTENLSGNTFEVVSVKKNKVDEIIFNESSEKWFIAKLSFITIDEVSGQEKKSAHLILVQSDKFIDAYNSVSEDMRSALIDYEVVSISETPILEVVR